MPGLRARTLLGVHHSGKGRWGPEVLTPLPHVFYPLDWGLGEGLDQCGIKAHLHVYVVLERKGASDSRRSGSYAIKSACNNISELALVWVGIGWQHWHC